MDYFNGDVFQVVFLYVILCIGVVVSVSSLIFVLSNGLSYLIEKEFERVREQKNKAQNWLGDFRSNLILLHLDNVVSRLRFIENNNEKRNKLTLLNDLKEVGYKLNKIIQMQGVMTSINGIIQRMSDEKTSELREFIERYDKLKSSDPERIEYDARLLNIILNNLNNLDSLNDGAVI
ncbi:MAG: hypothetical protein R3B60_02490 [Candidatus Paceibacterota bacterium]